MKEWRIKSYPICLNLQNAFSGLKEDRMLTHNELVRAIRFMIAAEYEAIQLYTQLAESTDNKLAQEVLLTSPMKKRNTPATSPSPPGTGPG